MSFSDEDNGVSFTGSGIAGPYATTWRVENEDHIGVGIRDTTDTTDDNAGTVLEIDTHYTVDATTIGLDSGAQITLLSPYNALSSDYKIRLWDKTAKTQPTELSNTYDKTAIENALDHLARGLNAAQEELDRSLKFSPILDDESEKVSPTAAAITNNYIPYPNANTVLTYTASGWKLSTLASLGALSFPGSTTDGQHIRADGTDGDAYQTSALIENDTADFTGIRHLTITGNLTLSASATVDGRDVSADGTQLDTNTSAISTNASNISTNTTAIALNTAKVSATEANVKSALDGATITEVDPVSGDQILIQDASDSNNLKTIDYKWMNRAPDIIIEHQEASSTDGGTATSGSWETGTLNTEVRDVNSDITLSSNVISGLPAGDYYCEFWAAFYGTNDSTARIYNIDQTAEALLGCNARSDSTDPSNTFSRGEGVITIATNDTLRLERQVQDTNADQGWGNGVAWATNRYACIKLWRLS